MEWVKGRMLGTGGFFSRNFHLQELLPIAGGITTLRKFLVTQYLQRKHQQKHKWHCPHPNTHITTTAYLHAQYLPEELDVLRAITNLEDVVQCPGGNHLEQRVSDTSDTWENCEIRDEIALVLMYP